ncbi:MAG: glucose-6-phosphate isomerase [Verrucomicrobiota bacterium]|nr:glucose-6-phosphate isomerase [Verrucomicrobiota bacterium]
MSLPSKYTWENFQRSYTEFPSINLAIDLSRSSLNAAHLQSMEPLLQKAFRAMAELEKGAIANPDEKRMVGHYWLRNPALAPNVSIRNEITETLAAIKKFAAQVHSGEIKGASGPFKRLLIIGIGGSALGPQFVASALGHARRDRMKVHFFDNTDPDGMDKALAEIGNDPGATLTVVISKSGGTKETRNGMLEARAAYTKAGLSFEKHAVAITGVNSELDRYAQNPAWLARFPMWDWVGGRTSETSAVGLLPALLQGIDIDQLLAGAAACDELTRVADYQKNPSAQLALAWHKAVNGIGAKDMVILPYKDRLELFSRYLQQLVMESIGKEKDLDGKVVNQGIAVYGNKGSTDQHAYIQQLRDGLNNFFATFIEVRKDREGSSMEVEPSTTSGDYLLGFLLGTREALTQNNRESITLTIDEVSPFSIGVLIALYERAVGFYATLVNINAYHQPGVEAGKKAAGAVLELQLQLLKYLRDHAGEKFKITQLATALNAAEQTETIFRLCEHLSANQRLSKTSGVNPFDSQYQLKN